MDQETCWDITSPFLNRISCTMYQMIQESKPEMNSSHSFRDTAETGFKGCRFTSGHQTKHAKSDFFFFFFFFFFFCYFFFWAFCCCDSNTLLHIDSLLSNLSLRLSHTHIRIYTCKQTHARTHARMKTVTNYARLHVHLETFISTTLSNIAVFRINQVQQ